VLGQTAPAACNRAPARAQCFAGNCRRHNTIEHYLPTAGHATTAVVSAKGGVGKTTTSVNLGAALASLGQTVLVVDLDCQASASLSLGLQRHQFAPSAADVLLRDEPAGRAIKPTRTPGLWVLPASADLLSVEADLMPARGRERVLARALEPLRERFEHVIIDCPPGMGLLTRNALVAADGFLVPAVPHYLAIEGLQNLIAAVERLDFRCQTRTPLVGIVPTSRVRRRGLRHPGAHQLAPRRGAGARLDDPRARPQLGGRQLPPPARRRVPAAPGAAAPAACSGRGVGHPARRCATRRGRGRRQLGAAVLTRSREAEEGRRAWHCSCFPAPA
jgi:chromosome partitioning protein